MQVKCAVFTHKIVKVGRQAFWIENKGIHPSQEAAQEVLSEEAASELSHKDDQEVTGKGRRREGVLVLHSVMGSQNMVYMALRSIGLTWPTQIPEFFPHHLAVWPRERI